jgi:hypothetical protein
MGDSLVAVPNLARDLLVAVDDLAHLRFDLRQVVERERRIAREVVIEAVLDGRADGDLRTGEQLLHRLGHHMARVVADGVEDGGIVAHQKFDLGVGHDRPVEIAKLAVDAGQGRALGQRGRDGLSHAACGQALVVVTDSPIRELKFHWSNSHT